MKQVLFILVIIFPALLLSCKKDSFITSGDARISISADTLRFDTVFTATGSVTQAFKIRNDNDQKLRLDDISLGGGSSSSFRINADGTPGPQVKNIEIEPKDSIYVFTTVSIDVNTLNLPFIIRDSILVSYNGRKSFIQLEAYGQNAHFLKNTEITVNATWTNDLPYVISGGLMIAENTILTIQKGVRVYFHADAPMIVNGTLKVEGNDSTRASFKGDRLDIPYSEYPGSWPGIYFRQPSKNNELHFAVLQNAYQGVVVEGTSVNANPKLTLNECIIDNVYDAGILGIQSSITATNCLISNAGGETSNNVCLVYGGSYDFTHCTIVSYGNSYINHKNPVLYLSNYITDNNIKYPADLTARFRNCIFWGDGGLVDDEVMVAKDGPNAFNATFSNCLWKVKNDPVNVTALDIIKNIPPVFDSINTGKHYYDFHLKENSPGIDKGITTSVISDLDGKPRPAGAFPDLGAYERR